ncbi:YpoC family protein [Neobacillus vireti]|uniref:YpoC family protein n=1 Tax=Neobacillus vireti TaxID=220686 RepID=UPI003000D019
MDNQLIIPFLDEQDLEPSKENIPLLLAEWDRLRDELEILYRNRDQKNTLQGMKKGISLFIQLLYLTNDRQVKVTELEPIDFIEIKPVNLDERLGFIIGRPKLFHSYRQLSELFIEQNKLYVKNNIVKKRLTSKG